MLAWETVDPDAIYPLERYCAVSADHEYRIFYGLKSASQDRPWVLVIREVGMACTRNVHHPPHRRRGEESRRAMGMPATVRVTGPNTGSPV